ncbi:hypothetical protein ABZ299_09645 [Streptomyces sp. NPDC006184]|uniref:hypothetical protein n=1 Tax=Streptomyces sp. NPDC006184 TaxID=3155455 RepID=UPI0033BB370A
MTDTRRRLRSGTVVLGGMGLLAAALTACSSEPDKRCVDRDSYSLTKGYRVVPDKNCKTGVTSPRTGARKKTPGKSLGKTADAAWYYEGDEKHGWVDGGSFTAPGKGGRGSSDDDGHHGTGVHRGGFGGGKGSSGG